MGLDLRSDTVDLDTLESTVKVNLSGILKDKGPLWFYHSRGIIYDLQMCNV